MNCWAPTVARKQSNAARTRIARIMRSDPSVDFEFTMMRGLPGVKGGKPHARSGQGGESPPARTDFSSPEIFFARRKLSSHTCVRLLRGRVRSLLLLRFTMMARALDRLVFAVVEADENGIVVVQLRARQRQHDEFRDHLEGRLHAARGVRLDAVGLLENGLVIDI